MILDFKETGIDPIIKSVEELIFNQNKYYYVYTFGCQQNEADSEKICAMAESMGYTRAETAEQADLVVVNTCAIREHAEGKALSLLGNFRLKKKNNPDLVNLAGFAAIGVFVGKKFYDFFSSVNANMTYDILFLAIGYIAIATIFAVMGTPSFLKMYYLKILRRMDINID